MNHKIYLAPPMVVGAHGVDLEWAGRDPKGQPLDEPIPVDLRNPREVLEAVYRLKEVHLYENVSLWGMMLGAVDWLTLQEYFVDRGAKGQLDPLGPKTGWFADEKVLFFEGVRLLMDPKRDFGPAEAVYDDDAAVTLFCLRKKGRKLP
jgi:hypothetical protein